VGPMSPATNFPAGQASLATLAASTLIFSVFSAKPLSASLTAFPPKVLV